jgi:phosphoribosylformylglycinamidine synthase
MTTPRVLVLRTAGTNCDLETVHAFEVAGGAPERIHIHRLFAQPGLLDRYHILALPGGFTYGDDLGAGRILAAEIRFRLGDEVRRFVEGGKLVLGICNGFQVLVHAGILPGGAVGRGERAVTLTFNESNRFEDRWVWLEAATDRSAFVEKGRRVFLPVAHGEGRFLVRDRGVLEDLEREGQVLFRYVDAQGRSCGYPGNPNGSVGGIAGITDPTGRILGMMPHPERHVHRWQHPTWTRSENGPPRGDGFEIFERAVETARRELA